MEIHIERADRLDLTGKLPGTVQWGASGVYNVSPNCANAALRTARSIPFFLSLTIFIGFIITMPAFAYAAAHYVDNAAAAGGEGSSWATAWKYVGDIDWTRIGPGDTLYISGGSQSKTYHETLEVSADGTAGAPIVITRGVTAGHDGTVVLDGQLSLQPGVHVEDDDYITVRGLHVQNFTGSGQIRVRYSTGVVVEDNKIVVTGHGGVYLWSNNNVIVRNNIITTPENSHAQTDGLYSQYNTGNVYAMNDIVISAAG